MQALKQPIYYIVLMLFSFATKGQPLPTFNNVGKFNCVGEQEKYRNYHAFFYTRNSYYSFVELGANLFKSKIDGEDFRVEHYDSISRKTKIIKLPSEFLSSKFEYIASHYNDNNFNIYLQHYNKEQKKNFIFCFSLNEVGDGLVASKVLDFPSAKKDKFEKLIVNIGKPDNTASIIACYTIDDKTSASVARCQIGGSAMQNFVTAPIPKLSVDDLTQAIIVGTDKVFFSFFTNPEHNIMFESELTWDLENESYSSVAIATKASQVTKKISFKTQHSMPYFFVDKANLLKMASITGSDETTIKIYSVDDQLNYVETASHDIQEQYKKISGKSLKDIYKLVNGTTIVTGVEQTKHGEMILSVATLYYQDPNAKYNLNKTNYSEKKNYYVGPILLLELSDNLGSALSTCGINGTVRCDFYTHFDDPTIMHGANKKSWYPQYQSGSYFDRSNENFNIPQDKSAVSNVYANGGYAYSNGQSEVITKYHVLNDRILRIKHNKLFVDIATASF